MSQFVQDVSLLSRVQSVLRALLSVSQKKKSNIDWLIQWLVDWLIDWLIQWLIECVVRPAFRVSKQNNWYFRVFKAYKAYLL